FHQQDLAKHFYESAIRFDEMFERVILPLRGTRNVNVESDFTEETATTFRKHCYAFRNIDIILLEGIFLFKPMYREHFDLKVWIDCSFATALRRTMARGQEGLPPQEAKRVPGNVLLQVARPLLRDAGQELPKSINSVTAHPARR